MFQPTCSEFVNNLAPSSAVDVHCCTHLSWRNKCSRSGCREGGWTDCGWLQLSDWLRLTPAHCDWLRLIPPGSGWLGWLRLTRLTPHDFGWLRLTAADSGWLRLPSANHLTSDSCRCMWKKLERARKIWMKMQVKAWKWNRSIKYKRKGCEAKSKWKVPSSKYKGRK